ncbi:hypothetical protein WR25_21170 isoform B [Diploscapter pachys]|nr:hypothetical protein WR25_21170 isoform B [Diploscapter pachys]
MCVDCRKYVCQRNCGVETLDHQRGEVVFLCKICSEAREVLWKKSGAWFYKEIPDFVRPDVNGSVVSPPHSQPKVPHWTTQISPSTSTNANGPQIGNGTAPGRRQLPSLPEPRSPSVPTSNRNGSVVSLLSASNANTATSTLLQAGTTPNNRPKSPRPRIEPSWVKEKVMSSMSVDDEDRSSSEGEDFVQSGVMVGRRLHKHSHPGSNKRDIGMARFALAASRITDSDEESSPESHASTRSGSSPRRSLATPSSYDSTGLQLASNPGQMIPSTSAVLHEKPDDTRSIDSGVVQSDHSNPAQQTMTLSASSLTPFHQSNVQPEKQDTISHLHDDPRHDSGISDTRRFTQSNSGSSLVTPPPIPPRVSPERRVSNQSGGTRQMSIESQSRKTSANSSSAKIKEIINRVIGGIAWPMMKMPPGTSLENVNESVSMPSTSSRTESPQATFMSSPDDDTKNRARRRAAVSEIDPEATKLAQTASIDIYGDIPEEEDEEANAAGVNASASGLKPIRQLTLRSTDTLMTSDEEDSLTSSATNAMGTLGSIQFNLTYDQQEKKLTIDLVKAKSLKAMDSNGLSDPYVKLHLLPGNQKATKLTSKTIEKTLNPEWNETLVYHGITEEDKQKKTLRITVLDRDRIGSDFLGETRIALRKLPNNNTKKFNLYLEHAIPVPHVKEEEGKERGKILVGLQYNIQQGTLYASIKRCAELIGMDKSGFSDPYCKV